MTFTQPRLEKEKPEELERVYHHYEHTKTSKEHHFYLYGAIGDPGDYIDMIHKIRTSSEGDIIHIHLNTIGGTVDTGIQMINAMQSSSAHVVTHLEPMAHSLGTMIFLAGDEFVVYDDSIMMFHNYSGFVAGKGHEQIAQVNAVSQWLESVTRRLYLPFLSEDELERMYRGEDIWMTAPEIRERLLNMVEILKEQAEKEKAEEEQTKKADSNGKRKSQKSK